MKAVTASLQRLLNQPSHRKIGGLVALALLGGWIVWLQDFSQSPPRAQLPQVHGEPDYYLEDATLKRYNAQGRHHQTLEGKVVTHYPNTQLTTVDLPRVHHWSEDGQLWILSALEGEIREDNEIYLQENVRLTPINPDSAYTPEFATQRLWLDTQTETARTPDPVSFSSQGGLTQGLGLFAQLATGQIEILEQVSSEYLTEFTSRNTQEQP
ncbi:LPS export ABC transporter protein LptC [Marinospirillum celere]|uniref:Lipopolysaccharide export system protein LptC n=1 Tax=Marinospirillum celere TaxID=1122252 RepID=A0A1I1G273_9GAMM|nr:LPS export ABC transporter periplasmic protein LptC [Marinospirillum celere]SFC03928.1 LPS export ABC transporter protein LptC [Marinospirillum celere]